VGWAPADRDDEAPEGPTARSERMARLEAALFLAREPTGTRKLAELADLADGTEARTLVGKLNRRYDAEGCAFRAVEVAGGFQLMSRAKFVPWLRRLHASPVEVRLSGPALETLAVVAYRQPVLRAEIEAVRGVQCGEILRQLMERELVRIVGRSEELGRPFLYGTTKRFLEVFGMRHLEELPRPRRAQAGGAVRPEPAPLDPLPPGATPAADRPIDSSKTEGELKVTSASDTIGVVEENSAPGIEDANPQALSADEDHSNLTRDYDDDFDEDEDDFDDYDDEDDDDEDDDYDDYDEDDYEDDEEDDFEDDEDEDDDDDDFEDDDWEEVEDDEDEDLDDEDDDDDWDDDDEDDEEDDDEWD